MTNDDSHNETKPQWSTPQTVLAFLSVLLPITLIVLFFIANQPPRPQYYRSIRDVPNIKECFRNFPSDGEVWVLADPRTGGRIGFMTGSSSEDAIKEFVQFNEFYQDSNGDEMNGVLENQTTYEVPQVVFTRGDPYFFGPIKGCGTGIIGAYSRASKRFVLRFNGQ